MPGYEELTPDQIIYIVNLVSIVVIVFVVGQIFRTILTLKISKNVKSLELMIEKKIDEGIKKPSFFEAIKLWWAGRKNKKKQEELYKPIGE